MGINEEQIQISIFKMLVKRQVDRNDSALQRKMQINGKIFQPQGQKKNWTNTGTKKNSNKLKARYVKS